MKILIMTFPWLFHRVMVEHVLCLMRDRHMLGEQQQRGQRGPENDMFRETHRPQQYKDLSDCLGTAEGDCYKLPGCKE